MTGMRKKTMRKGVIIQLLKPSRLFNAFLIVFSYHISRLMKRNVHLGNPVSITIEPTTACNLRCPECPSGLRQFTRPTGNVNVSLMKQLIDEQARTLMYCNFYFQGEPFIHPNIIEMIAYASGKGVLTSTSTNAHFISEKSAEAIVLSGLNRLIISIDGTTQEVYEQYRKEGRLNKVIEGTKHLVAAQRKFKSSIQIVFQFLVVKPNEHQVEEVKDLGKKLGVDKVVFKTAQLYDYKNGHELMPENQQYSRYKKLKNGTFELKNKLLNQCWRLWSGSVMTWDGRIVPCCFDKDAKHEMGQITQQSFANIWRNDSYKAFRNQIIQSRKSIDICTNCSEGTKVWAND